MTCPTDVLDRADEHVEPVPTATAVAASLGLLGTAVPVVTVYGRISAGSVEFVLSAPAGSTIGVDAAVVAVVACQVRGRALRTPRA